MSACPPIEQLLEAADAETAEHVRSCRACQLVLELAQARRPRAPAALAEPDDDDPDDGELRTFERTLFTRGDAVAGIGGMSVCRAWDRDLGRALWLWEARDEPGGPQLVRLLRTLSRVSHAAVPTILTAGVWSDGAPFFATRVVEGRPFADAVATRHRGEAVLSMLAAVDGVAAAHAARIVHGHLVPASIRLGRAGAATVLGWEHASSLDEPAVAAAPCDPGDRVAPEVAAGDPPDARADVFQLGLLLQAMLGADGNAALAAVVARATATDPDDRPATARELADALSAALVTPGRGAVATATHIAADTRLPRAPLVILAACALAVAAAGFWSVTRARRQAEHEQHILMARLAGEWTAEGRREQLAGEPRRALAYLAAVPPELADVAFATVARSALRDARAEEQVLVGGVTGAWFSPDGAQVLTTGLDGDARLWAVATGASVAVLGDHTRAVRTAAFSPDGATIATGSDDGTVKLWDARRGVLRATLRASAPDTRVEQLLFGADGMLLVRDAGGGLRLWNGQRATLVITGCRAAALAPDGRQVAVVVDSSAVALIDLVSGVRTPGPSLDQPTAVAFASDGGLAVVGVTGEVTVAPRAGEATTFQALGIGEGRGLAWSRNGRALLIMGTRGAVVWRRDAGALPAIVAGDVETGDLSPDGSRIALGFGDGHVRVWDVLGFPLATLAGHAGTMRAARFSPDGRLLVTASDDGTARVWSVTTAAVRGVRAGDRAIVALAFEATGIRVLRDSADVELWNPEPLVLMTDRKLATDVLALAVDGGRVAVAGPTGIAIHDVSGHAPPITVGESMGRARAAWFAPGGERVLLVGANGDAAIFSVSGKSVTVPLPVNALAAAAWSTDGKMVLTGDSDGAGRLWETAHGTLVATYPGDGAAITAVGVDASSLVLGDARGGVRVCDVSGRVLSVADGHAGAVSAIAFDGHGRFATAGRDGRLALWDASGHLLDRFDAPSALIAVGFSPDGERLAAGGEDGTLLVVDVAASPLSAAELRGLADAAVPFRIGDDSLVREPTPAAQVAPFAPDPGCDSDGAACLKLAQARSTDRHAFADAERACARGLVAACALRLTFADVTDVLADGARDFVVVWEPTRGGSGVGALALWRFASDGARSVTLADAVTVDAWHGTAIAIQDGTVHVFAATHDVAGSARGTLFAVDPTTLEARSEPVYTGQELGFLPRFDGTAVIHASRDAATVYRDSARIPAERAREDAFRAAKLARAGIVEPTAAWPALLAERVQTRWAGMP